MHCSLWSAFGLSAVQGVGRQRLLLILCWFQLQASSHKDSRGLELPGTATWQAPSRRQSRSERRNQMQKPLLSSPGEQERGDWRAAGEVAAPGNGWGEAGRQCLAHALLEQG